MSATATRTQYQLACPCGQSVLVDRSQAGLTVHCVCGAALDVPTIRGLNQLPKVQTEAKRRALDWNTRRAAIVVGLLLATLGFGVGGARHFFPPELPFTAADVERDIEIGRDAIEKAPLTKTWELWEALSKGLNTSEMPSVLVHRFQLAHNRRWMLVMYTVGASGLLVVVGALLLRR